MLYRVALLAEGVDRNASSGGGASASLASPSSRRAWIEIASRMKSLKDACVALLAEGVERNTEALKDKLDGIGRPPRGGRG